MFVFVFSCSPVRVAWLTHTGKRVFSAGLDLNYMMSCIANKSFEPLAVYLQRVEQALLRLLDLPAPVIAAVNSHCIAGGQIMACACDYRISDGRGKCGMNEVQNGFVPPFPLMEVRAHCTLMCCGFQPACALECVKPLAAQ